VAPSSNGATIYSYEGEVVGVTGAVGTFNWWANGQKASPKVDLQVTFTPADDPGGFFQTQFQYKFRVRAVNELGMSEWSAYTSTEIAPKGYMLGVPIIPPGFGRYLKEYLTDTDIPAEAGKIRIHSLELLDPDAGGDRPENLRYEFWGGQAAPTTLLATDHPNRELTVDAYPHGSTWVFKSRVTNNAGVYSDWTPEVALVSAGKPDPPMHVNIENPDNTDEVVISWTVPYDGGTYITAYECRRFEPNQEEWFRYPNTMESCVRPNQNTGGNAFYQVRAWNSVGPSEEVTIEINFN
jgi:hypothetical protein